MDNRTPRVSIALPVFNGEGLIDRSIDSILVQSFEDFELVISDNGSTDRTEEICRSYAAKDQRIRYYRNHTNIGGAKNFAHAFELCSAEYFKWQSHDDELAPDFLLRCVEILDQNPSVVLAFSRMQIIDEDGNVKKTCEIVEDISFAKPQKRFAHLALQTHAVHHVWGLIRRNVLAQTPLLGPYIANDVPLVAEIGLYGPFYDCDESLFRLRAHSGRSVYAYPFYVRAAWFDPDKKGKMIFPNWRIFGEHCKAIGRAPLRWNERLGCYVQMGHWLLVHWNAAKLIMDLFVAVFPRLAEVDLKIKAWYHKRKGHSRAKLLGSASSQGLSKSDARTENH